ncbi:MAG TPA: DUF1491 family protein [Sphingomicrobium sp.]|nr:DUF1491 family protein [Sphingomicrobium sp.]
MNERLPARLEVATLLRRAQSGGGFATVARRGDPDRGDIVVHLVQRGADVALLERRMGDDFTYRWTRRPAPEQGMAAFSSDRARIDPDFWLIELDIADAERFVAEMIHSG